MKYSLCLRKILLNASVFLVILFLMAPIIVLIGASFTPDAFLEFPPKGFSIKWYEALFSNTAMMHSFWISFQLAVISALCGVLIGTISAYGLERSHHRDSLLSFFISPLIVPGVIIGLAILRFCSMLNWDRGFLILLAGHIIIIIPYAVRTISASLYRYNISLEEAAQTLGAGKITTFCRITLPILKPGLIASACFGFIISFGNLSVSIFLSSARMAPLPIRIYNTAEFSPDPTLAAVSAVTLFMTFILMLIVEKTAGLDKIC